MLVYREKRIRKMHKEAEMCREREGKTEGVREAEEQGGNKTERERDSSSAVVLFLVSS